MRKTLFILSFIYCFASLAAGEECPVKAFDDCVDLPKPALALDMAQIHTHVHEKCEASDIIVKPRHPDDICAAENLQKLLGGEPLSGGNEVMYDTDPLDLAPGATCPGVISREGLCYPKTSNLYATSLSTRVQRDPSGEGLRFDIKNSGCPRCPFPYERDQLSFIVPFENVYDGVGGKDLVVECHPRTCYTISLASKSGGDSVMITVTRTSSGGLETKLYVNKGSDLYSTEKTFD